MEDFSIEITVDGRGVRAVRLYGADWERSAQGYALLGKVGWLLRQLDVIAKGSVGATTPRGSEDLACDGR